MPEKPFVKLQPAYSVKLVFSNVVKGVKIKITAEFRASRRLRFEDKKAIMSFEMRPKSFGNLEKRDPAPRGFSPITCIFSFQQNQELISLYSVSPSEYIVRERHPRTCQLVPRVSRARLFRQFGASRRLRF